MPSKNATVTGRETRAQLTLGIRDVLDLIPDYEEREEVDFVRFEEGCREALELVGAEYEKTLLAFLKLKLKGDIRAVHSLHVAKYKELEAFLTVLRTDFVDMSDIHTWKSRMYSIRQMKYEPIREYGNRFIELLQCAKMALNRDYVLNIVAGKEIDKPKDIDDIEFTSLYCFKQNLISVELQQSVADELKTVRDLQQFIDITEALAFDLERMCTRCKVCYSIGHVDGNCTALERNYDDYGATTKNEPDSKPNSKPNYNNNGFEFDYINGDEEW